MIASGVGGIAAVFALALQYFRGNRPQPTEQSRQMIRGGDFPVRGGDGAPAGKGGDVHIGSGIYKAGDAIQSILRGNIPKEMMRS
jgi:hypothetical protein